MGVLPPKTGLDQYYSPSESPSCGGPVQQVYDLLYNLDSTLPPAPPTTLNGNPAIIPGGLQFTQNLNFNGTAIQKLGAVIGGSAYTPGNIPITLGAITGGTLYTPGTYNSVPTTTSGSGSGLIINVVVNAAGAVAQVTLNNATSSGYAVNDTISATAANLGGTGSGFSVSIATVGYINVPLTGGTGSGATANITISAGGAVINAGLILRGNGYSVNDNLSADPSTIGGTGSGFSVSVSNIATAQDQTEAYIWAETTLKGSLVPGAGQATAAPYQIFITNDTVNSLTSFPIFSVEEAPGTGHNGGRTAIQGYTAIVGTPTAVNLNGYVGILAQARVAANLTGTSGVYANYKGNVFAGNSNLFGSSLATFISTYCAHEMDVALPVGASAAEKHALTLVLTSTDNVRATYDDNALQFNAQDNTSAVGWKTGIMFGGYGHQWPFATDSTLIGAQIRQAGPASSSVALNGVDFTGVTFQTGGYAFRSTGFGVDGPTGNVLLGSTVELQFNADTIIGRKGAANIRLGDVDAAAAIAQTISVQNVATGTSNTAGANLTIIGSQGTGTGGGGQIIFQTSPIGSSGSTQNNPVRRLTCSNLNAVLVGNFANAIAINNSNAGMLQVANNSTVTNVNCISNLSYGNTDTSPAVLYLAKNKNASIGLHTAVVSGTQLGSILGDGSDGTTFVDATQILLECDGTVAANQVPGRVRILTANASGTLTEAMRLDKAQLAIFAGPVKTLSTTVSGLPPAATAGSGARAFVTDATATTFLSTVAGGGSNKVPVVSDGTNWLIG